MSVQILETIEVNLNVYLFFLFLDIFHNKCKLYLCLNNRNVDAPTSLGLYTPKVSW